MFQLDSNLPEWLETNGLGGFASSTIVGCNTRRYHGLLVAATRPPVGRMVLLSKLEETLVLGDRRWELSVNQYPGAIHPQGHRFLKAFRPAPVPVFTYEVEGIEIEKTVFMRHGENTTVIQYEVRGAAPEGLRLEIRPLIAFRDYHATTHENGALAPRVEFEAGRATMKPYADLPALHLAHNAVEAFATGDWYRNFEYAVERERGLDFREDLFNPLALRFDLTREPRPAILASTEPRDVADASAFREAELRRREGVAATVPGGDAFRTALAQAADQFLVARGDQYTVIAGYHWFSDWGRDTMIALPGLTLATGRDDVARGILLAFARVVDRGMLPNRFPDGDEAPEYNTVDATLWYFEAIRALLEQTHDEEFVREQLYPVLIDIIDWHVRGTRYNIHVEEDGLLFAGEPGQQLTWMDARVDGRVITPRIGKPVEIQALWHNALRVMEGLAQRFGEAARAERYGAMAVRAAKSFNEVFWNDEAGCLYDVIEGETRDASIRPNQIFAVSLPHALLSPERAAQVLAVVERDLLTPYGLRTLAPSDPQYIGRYAGGPVERDSAYHQGTVWPWLLGPFITAWRKVHGDAPAMRWLAALEDHLQQAGLGQISEVFDGDPPHRPGGCIAQAWSVAALLEALSAGSAPS